MALSFASRSMREARAASFVALTISGLYRSRVSLTSSRCTAAVFAFGVRRLPRNRDAPLSKRMDISLVPRHFPVQGDVSILPAVPPNACAITPIFSCVESVSYFSAIAAAFFCKSVRGGSAFSLCSSCAAARSGAAFSASRCFCSSAICPSMLLMMSAAAERIVSRELFSSASSRPLLHPAT